MDVKEESILGSEIATHWYYVAKGRALRRFLGNIKAESVLDVGAGSGIFSRQLLDAGICQEALCVDPAYRAERAEFHHGRPIRFVRSVDRVAQRLVLMMDVLEHVDDDVGLLRHYTATMPPEGHVLITVPAFSFLWSGHDVFLEHLRRYTKRTLETIVGKAGLHVVRSRYFFGTLFPAIAALRWRERRRIERGKVAAKSDLKSYPAPVNSALIRLHEIECGVLFPINRFAGLTLFCLARKPA